MEELRKIRDDLVKESWKYWQAKELQMYFEEKHLQLDRGSLLDLLILLTEKDVFPWLDFISSKLAELVDMDDKFMELLRQVSEKVQNDLAQGSYVKALISIGETSPNLGLVIGQKMMEKRGVLVTYAGFPLGGAGRKNKDRVLHLVEQLYSSDDAGKRFCSIRTLRVMFEDKKITDAEKIFQLLRNASKEYEDINVRAEGTQAFLDFYDVNPILCKEELMGLARQHSILRLLIANRLCINPLANLKDTIELLRACSEDDNINVRERVSYALTRIADNFPAEVMEIIKLWIKSDGYVHLSMKYLLGELGKSKFDTAMNVVKDWIDNEKDWRVTFNIPKIVNDLLPDKGKYILIPYLESWLQYGETYREIVLNTLLEVLSHLYPAESESQLLDSSFGLLSQFVRSKGFDPNLITKGESNRILRCARIIDFLKHFTKSLDYDRILTNLRSFPNLEDLLGRKWFEQKRKENNRTHLLLRVLAREIPKPENIRRELEKIQQVENEKGKMLNVMYLESLLGDMYFLKRLDTNIAKLANNGLNMSGFRTKLMNEEEVDSTLSEIEFVAPFVGASIVEIEPKVDDKKLDAKIQIDKTTLFIEVISPDMFEPLKLLGGPFTIKNRIKSKIFEEFKEQLSALPSVDQAVLIVVDIGRSEVDYDFVEDYLFGTLKLTMMFDKEKHELVGSHPERNRNSMHELRPEMDVISAVICFKTRIGDNARYRTEGKIIVNPYAKTPLSKLIMEKIEKTLFVEFNGIA